jgi:hypothetical protein
MIIAINPWLVILIGVALLVVARLERLDERDYRAKVKQSIRKKAGRG